MIDHDCSWKENLKRNGDFIDLFTNKFRITIEKRPNYCDRGNYLVKCDNLNFHGDIEWSDGFPRYYFEFECMVREIAAFLTKREDKVVRREAHPFTETPTSNKSPNKEII